MKFFDHRAHVALLLAGALSVGGCGQLRTLVDGPGYDIDKAKVAAYAQDQNAVVLAVSQMAGLGDREPGSPAEWRRFVLAGIQYSDRQCEAYMNALFWFNRAKARTTNQITLAGAATSAIMGALSASTQALTITAIAFGLAGATTENIGSGLLYDLDPSAVRDLVRKLQMNYESGLPQEGYKDRASAFRALQHYIAICLPPSIETQIVNSVKNAKADVEPGNAETGAPPIVQIGPLQIANYGEDENSELIRSYLYRDGVLDADRRTKLLAEMEKAGVTNTSPVLFTRAAQYRAARAKVVAALKLKK